MKNFTNIAFTAFVATATIGATAAFIATHNGAEAVENFGQHAAPCTEQGWLFEVEGDDRIIAINFDGTYHMSGKGEEYNGNWTKISAETVRVSDSESSEAFDITPICNDGSFRF